MSQGDLSSGANPILRARELVRAGLYDQAAGLLRPLLTDPNERPYALETLAECRRTEGGLALARYLYTEAIRCNRGDRDLVAVSRDTERDYEERIDLIQQSKPGILLLLLAFAAMALGGLLFAGTVPGKFADQFKLFFDVDALKYAAGFRAASIASGIVSLSFFVKWVLKRLNHRRSLRIAIGEDLYGPKFIDCWACQLRYRKNLKACPYCGSLKKRPKQMPLPSLPVLPPVISAELPLAVPGMQAGPPPLPTGMAIGQPPFPTPSGQGGIQGAPIPPSGIHVPTPPQPPPLPSAGQSAEPPPLPSPPPGPSEMAGLSPPPPLPALPITIPAGPPPLGHPIPDTRFEPPPGLGRPSGETQDSIRRIGTGLAILVGILLGVALFSYFRPARSLGPEETVRQAASAVAEGSPQGLWDLLPTKYQKDVEDLIRGFAGAMDAEVWKGALDLADRAVAVADAKRDLFLKSETFRATNPNEEKMAREALDIGLEAANNILKSDLRDLNSLKNPRVRKWLADPVAKAAKRFRDFVPTTDGKGREFYTKLKSVKVSVVTQEGDKAKVRLEAEGERPEDLEMSRVENRWLPAEMVREWPDAISSAKNQIAEMGKELEQNKVMLMAGLGAAGAMVDALEKDQTLDLPFNALPDLSQLLGPGLGGGKRAPPSTKQGVLDGMLKSLGAAAPMKSEETIVSQSRATEAPTPNVPQNPALPQRPFTRNRFVAVPTPTPRPAWEDVLSGALDDLASSDAKIRADGDQLLRRFQALQAPGGGSYEPSYAEELQSRMNECSVKLTRIAYLANVTRSLAGCMGRAGGPSMEGALSCFKDYLKENNVIVDDLVSDLRVVLDETRCAGYRKVLKDLGIWEYE